MTARTLRLSLPPTKTDDGKLAQAILCAELTTAKGGLMGQGSVLCSDLKKGTAVAVRIKPVSDDSSRRSDSKKEPVTLFVRAADPPPRFKWLFFVRHGQSKWNKASAEKNVIALVKEVDHSLAPHKFMSRQ